MSLSCATTQNNSQRAHISYFERTSIALFLAKETHDIALPHLPPTLLPLPHTRSRRSRCLFLLLSWFIFREGFPGWLFFGHYIHQLISDPLSRVFEM